MAATDAVADAAIIADAIADESKWTAEFYDGTGNAIWNATNDVIPCTDISLKQYWLSYTIIYVCTNVSTAKCSRSLINSSFIKFSTTRARKKMNEFLRMCEIST